jgi:tetratricopeptide (TPR) repeat protein
MKTRAIAVILMLASATAMAAPKKKAARAEFDRGVAAYTKGDYQGASDALGASYGLEPDEETLFAWAQTERKLGHCDKAIELYTKLLAMNLPAANKAAVEVQISECKQILDEERAAAAVVDGPAPNAEPAADAAPSADPAAPAAEPVTGAPADSGSTRPRWKDPVGLSLVGVGVVGLAIGTVFLVKGSSAESDADHATSYADYLSASDRAESDGRLGVIGLVAGGAFVTAGIVWYVTHAPASTDRVVTGWVAPGSGGVAVSGRF